MAAYSATAGLLFSDTAAMHEVLAGVARNPDVQTLILRLFAETSTIVTGSSRPVTCNAERIITSVRSVRHFDRAWAEELTCHN